MSGFFGKMFDLNRDGKLNPWEKAAELAFMQEMMKDEKPTDFELSGLDATDLEFMNEEERRKVLEEAGLDPDEYSF